MKEYRTYNLHLQEPKAQNKTWYWCDRVELSFHVIIFSDYIKELIFGILTNNSPLFLPARRRTKIRKRIHDIVLFFQQVIVIFLETNQ